MPFPIAYLRGISSVSKNSSSNLIFIRVPQFTKTLEKFSLRDHGTGTRLSLADWFKKKRVSVFGLLELYKHNDAVAKIRQSVYINLIMRGYKGNNEEWLESLALLECSQI